jgi:hypothetical protein
MGMVKTMEIRKYEIWGHKTNFLEGVRSMSIFRNEDDREAYQGRDRE